VQITTVNPATGAALQTYRARELSAEGTLEFTNVRTVYVGG
jgi:hypothetical protein